MSLPDRFKASLQETQLKYHIIKHQENGDIWSLRGCPTIKFLKLLTTLENEMQPFELSSKWSILVGDSGGVFTSSVPMDATTIMHSHTRVNNLYRCMPSGEDFIHPRNPDGLYFIDSPLGIIRFWPINPPVDQYIKVYHWHNEQTKGGYVSDEELEQRYTQFLKEQGLKWYPYFWNQIRDEKDLKLILKGKE